MTSGFLTLRSARTMTRSTATDRRIAGALLALAGVTILMAIITAEALYPAAYSTGANEISDLGGTRPPNSVVLQPSATIFDAAMLSVGILIVAASWFVNAAFGRRSVALPMAVLGIGAAGVGLFPGNTGTPHALFAMATFISGGIAAVTSSRVIHGPFRLTCLALGAVALVTLALYLFLGDANPMGGLGIGGIERWIVDPIVLWATAFGGYLAGRGDEAQLGLQDDRERRELPH